MSKSYEERMRESLMAQYTGSKGGDPKPAKPEPTSPALKLFNPPSKTRKGMVEFKTIVGEAHEDGKKHYWPAAIQHKDTDWPELMRGRIPEKHDRHIPDHAYCEDILDALAFDKVLKAVGDPGSGKDTTIKWLCGILRIPYVREDGSEGKEAQDIVGYATPDTSGGYNEYPALLTLFVKHGGVYVDSEPDVNTPGTNMCKQHLQEDERIFKFQGHPDPEQAQIKAHKDFRLLMTSNTRGTGDDAGMFTATMAQDVSSINRVDIHSTVSYLPPEKEVLLVMKNVDGVTEAFAKKMVQMGVLMRNAWRNGDDDACVGIPFSPRQLLAWGEKAVRMGEPVKGFKQCYYNALDDVEKDFARKCWEDVDFGCSL